MTDPSQAPPASYEDADLTTPRPPRQGGPAEFPRSRDARDPYGAGSAVTADPMAVPRPAPPRWRFWTGLGCVGLVIVLVVGVGGWATVSHLQRPAPTAQATSGTGTFEDPYVIGADLATVRADGGSAELQLGTPDWDAYPEMEKLDRGLEEPASGQSYMTVPLTITYRGKQRVSPNSAFDLSYVPESGNAIDRSWMITPRMGSFGDMGDGMTQTIDVPFVVSTADARSGRFRVSSLGEEDVQWFRAA